MNMFFVFFILFLLFLTYLLSKNKTAHGFFKTHVLFYKLNDMTSVYLDFSL